MQNYIILDGVVYDLIRRTKSGPVANADLTAKVKLGDVPAGETFKIDKHEFVVLEHSKDTTAVILTGLLSEGKEFGNSNNFDRSNVGEQCQAFADEIAGIVGAENLVEHTVDLTSDDGLKDYGKVKRKMSLLTTELYRRYVYILDKFNPGKWWWLATAHSTETHSNANWVKCVSPSGNVNNDGYGNAYGVRPFCILNSSIFVSK